MTDRRLHRRYPVVLPISYQGRVISGLGLTEDLSSKGALILAAPRPKLGAHLELRMNWPALLDGAVGLQLVVTGRVARVTPQGFAMEFSRHEFRTVKAQIPVILKAAAGGAR
jgi:hypothetical protein